jgi:hypothetical protein
MGIGWVVGAWWNSAYGRGQTMDASDEIEQEKKNTRKEKTQRARHSDREVA